jgi:hypothetical protein
MGVVIKTLEWQDEIVESQADRDRVSQLETAAAI